MDDIVRSLKNELRQLESELRTHDPRFVKIEHIKALLAVYEPTSPHALGRGKKASNGASPGVSKGERIRAEIERLLGANRSLHRSAILAHLVEVGLMGSEKQPMANLAAYLSRWTDDFVSDGRGNFQLAPSRKSRG
jgi:hypothetical protein